MKVSFTWQAITREDNLGSYDKLPGLRCLVFEVGIIHICFNVLIDFNFFHEGYFVLHQTPFCPREI